MPENNIVNKCRILKSAYERGLLGNTNMPEDTHPAFSTHEQQLAYFTLPMSLNYQRNSYKLWKSALHTYEDSYTSSCFNIKFVSKSSENQLREYLLKYKLALQPNKHINTWKRIGTTIFENWVSFGNLFESVDYDFLKLKDLVQIKYKSDFPYLSGPKIFNYWSYIIQRYGDIELKNSEYIEIAPDTHVIQASVKLGVISSQEALKISRDNLSMKWRSLLSDSDILPIEMHSPLWFWSRNRFKYSLDL